MPEGVEQLLVVIDFNNFSLLKAPPLGVSKSFMDVLSAHYPERLYCGICVNPPWIFWTFWRVITSFLDPITAAKVKFIATNKENDVKQMHEICAPEHLEERLGGEYAFEYTFSYYWGVLKSVPHRIAF